MVVLLMSKFCLIFSLKAHTDLLIYFSAFRYIYLFHFPGIVCQDFFVNCILFGLFDSDLLYLIPLLGIIDENICIHCLRYQVCSYLIHFTSHVLKNESNYIFFNKYAVYM